MSSTGDHVTIEPTSEIRLIRPEEVKVITELANSEDWDISLEYMEASYNLSSSSWWGVATEGQIIGSCVVTPFDDPSTVMVGCLLLEKKYRGKGLARALIKRLLALGEEKKNILLIAIDVNQYMKYGFQPSFKMQRWSGKVKVPTQYNSSENDAFSLLSIENISQAELEEYDKKISGSPRGNFFRKVILGTALNTIVAVDNSKKIVGYGMARKTKKGIRISPVYGDTADVGRSLLTTLISQVKDGDFVSVDTFPDNEVVTNVLKDCGLTMILDVTHMYRGETFPMKFAQIHACFGYEFTPA